MKRASAVVVGLGLLAALAVGVLGPSSPASAAATAPTTGQIAHATGKITAIQGNSFTVQGAKGHMYTIAVDQNTWIVVKQAAKAAQGAVSDLKVGDTVRVAGVATAADHIAARVVADGVTAKAGKAAGKAAAKTAGKAAKHAKHAAVGLHATVQSAGNGTLTLTTGKTTHTRTVTVNTDAGTVVLKNGLATVGDLKAGDVVTILPRHLAQVPGATKPAPGTPRPTRTAALIYVPSADHVLVAAVVKSVAGNTLTVRAAAGERVIAVDANTQYKLLGGAGQAPTATALSAVQAGTRIVVYAAKPAAGQPTTAGLVLIAPAATK